MQWISVKDKLPNTTDSVLVYDGYCIYVCPMFSDMSGFDTSNSLYGVDPITYWMPLPEPPNAD